MTNHVHLVMVPNTTDGLARSLNTIHMRYAQYVNKEQGWNGRLWQGRYFSSPLDEAYMWSAIRYTERNPVGANMVERAELYPWSSAAAHCGFGNSNILTKKPCWVRKFRQVPDWSAWLSEVDCENDDETIRRHSQKGLPCGSSQFISKLERLAGRTLGYRHQGRPRKDAK
jgi:putative transposase